MKIWLIYCCETIATPGLLRECARLGAELLRVGICHLGTQRHRILLREQRKLTAGISKEKTDVIRLLADHSGERQRLSAGLSGRPSGTPDPSEAHLQSKRRDLLQRVRELVVDMLWRDE